MGNIFYFFTFPKYINGGLGTTFCNQKTSDVVRRGPKWSNWTQFHRGGPCQYQQEGKNTKTPNQIRVTLLCHGVPEILTLHGMSKMDFEPEFWNPQKLSYGVKNGRFGRERAFSLKKCRKNSVLGANDSGSTDFGEG